MARQFLGLYVTFTEDPIRESVRNAYNEAKAAGARTIWGIVLSEIDRTQDSEGLMDQTLELLQQARARGQHPREDYHEDLGGRGCAGCGQPRPPGSRVVPGVDQRRFSCQERRLHGPFSRPLLLGCLAVRTRLGGGLLLGRSGAPVLRVVEVHLPGGVQRHGEAGPV